MTATTRNHADDAGLAPADRTRLAAARLRAVDMQPFLAQALYAMVPVRDSGRGTFAVDGRWRLYVDPGPLQTWTIEECAGVLLHEVAHLVRDHAGRARSLGVGSSTADRWNLAADAEINDDLLADDARLPGEPVTPRRLGASAGRAAEFYFHAIETISDGQPPDVTADDCGSGCHGIDDGEETGDGDGVLPRGVGEPESLLIRHRVAQAIADAAGQGQGQGAGADGWRRWAEAVLAPRVDWRRLLGGAVRRSTAAVAGRVDYSYRHPSRRRQRGVVLPSMHRPLPRVAVVIDTSGSVSDAQLGLAWSEVHGCLRSIGVRRDLLRVYAADTEVHRIDTRRLRSAMLVGGGGTDMRRGIQAALDDTPRPDVIVVITDGLTPWPSRRPAARVVIALLESAGQPPSTPDWATVVGVPVPGGTGLDR